MAVAALALTACGGGADRPSVDEISAVFQEGGEIGGETMSVPEDQADCVAEAFHESDISDEALTALVEKDEDYEPSESDEKALETISTENVAECLGVELPQ